MSDLISREDAIKAVKFYETFCDPYPRVIEALEELPSAQPTQLTDEDKETIRIHLSAIKENLCNQRRWNEAEEYEELISRLLSAPSVQPRKGKWIGYNADDKDWQRDDGSPIFMNCSECHEAVINNGSAHWNFCPNCGADMREGDAE